MSLLQYTSNEMFSSTELIRKNKNIFDKLNKKEIEKAIILRDGKPGIILLDFDSYEKIMTEYLLLKEKDSNIHKSTFVEKKVEKIITKEIVEEKKEIKNEEDFSFDNDLSNEKSEPLKEFWD